MGSETSLGMAPQSPNSRGNLIANVIPELQTLKTE
jgi:hypothetical protein